MNLIFIFMAIQFSYNIAIANNGIIAKYDSMYSSPHGINRLLASQELSEGKAEGIDTITAVQMITSALASEITSPAPDNKANGAYVSGTEFLKKNYSIALVKLAQGREYLIMESLSNATGEFRERLIIALGFLKDDSVHREIGRIYSQSQDPYIRLAAIEALYQYQDTLDVPIFEKALYDSFYVYKFLNEDGKPVNTTHPIGVLAVGALNKMGYSVTPDSLGGYKVEKRER